MSKSIKEIRLHGSSVDLRDPVKKDEESSAQTGIHSFPKMSSSNEDEDEQNKSDPHAEITQDFIEMNNTPDKKNKCASLLDKYTSLRCLGIWVTVITLLFLTASVVCGVFLVGYIHTTQISLDDQQKELDDQKKHITDQQKTFSSLQQQLNGQQQINKELSATISQLQQKMSGLQHKNDIDVFFTGRPSSNYLTVQAGQTVVYGHVITSIGGGYNVSTGIFQAHKSGYYRADVNALARQNRQVSLRLEYNGASVVRVGCDPNGGNGNKNSCSNSAIVRLNQGDTLKVVAIQPSYLYSRYYNTFSVQLLSVE